MYTYPHYAGHIIIAICVQESIFGRKQTHVTVVLSLSCKLSSWAFCTADSATKRVDLGLPNV